jgi:hypothetical protein
MSRLINLPSVNVTGVKLLQPCCVEQALALSLVDLLSGQKTTQNLTHCMPKSERMA